MNFGETYILGNHTLICGDYLNAKIDIKADILLTDPPWGIDLNKKREKLSKINKTRWKPYKAKMVGDDHNFLKLLQNSLSKAHRETADTASFYIFAPIGDKLIIFLQALDLSEWMLKQQLTWCKHYHTFGFYDYFPRHENILYGWKKGSKHIFYKNGKQRDTVLFYNKLQKTKHHQAQKPVDLLINLINNSTKEGDIVLDPFCGSGSTIIACELTGRKCIGVEISPEFCSVAVSRWENLTRKKAKRLTPTRS